MTRNDPSQNRDEWLASFADQILNGEGASPTLDGSDPEMRALADTLLRLKNAMPNTELDPASVKRMRSQVLARWRAEKQAGPWWSNLFRLGWQSQARRQQTILAFAAVAIIAILIIASPFLTSGSGGTSATAGNATLFEWIALGVAILVAVWLLRRKK